MVLGSRLELRSLRHVPGFLGAAMKLRKQVRAMPGALGVSLIAQPAHKTFWTLSAWVDQASLDAFVATPAHVAVMQRYHERMNGSVVHHVDGEDRRPPGAAQQRQAALERGEAASRRLDHRGLECRREHAMADEISLEGWDIKQAGDEEWMPWSGSAGDARAKILGVADGYYVTLVEAQPGYAGSPHVHEHAEFNYVIDGSVRNQGQVMVQGDGYAAAAGSTHTDFATETGATYLVIFKI